MRYLMCLFSCLVTVSVFSEEGMDRKFFIEHMDISSDNASETSSLIKEGSTEKPFDQGGDITFFTDPLKSEIAYPLGEAVYFVEGKK